MGDSRPCLGSRRSVFGELEPHCTLTSVCGQRIVASSIGCGGEPDPGDNLQENGRQRTPPSNISLMTSPVPL